MRLRMDPTTIGIAFATLDGVCLLSDTTVDVPGNSFALHVSSETPGMKTPLAAITASSFSMGRANALRDPALGVLLPDHPPLTPQFEGCFLQ